MEHGKAKGAAGPEGLSDPLTQAVRTRDAEVMTHVRAAVDANEMALAFQPIVRAGPEGRVAYYEGLVRIFDPSGRIIPAAEFMAEAEISELGRQIDCIALELGLRTLQAQPHLRLAINMSARSIGYPRWMRTLKRALMRDSTLGDRLILEITEQSAMLVPELVVNFMRDLQRQGISFALDDFGAGYTSFRFLRDFYFDILKIDGGFIRGIADNPDNQVLTRALITIGQQFDMFTVAERVEDSRDAAWLTENGIQYLQGYYFAAPTLYPPWAKRPA
ncbi:EAL domain-containing protein [Pseudooceanicola sp. CBS1P-1]|uniref:EAL domain-containing protein n=1 Tax=Pseudooceanicola albus TaxID=2692189 RepID=A0A6L7G677_9RHOB|nr:MULTISPECIES: EAL domain-containing protein [Pseudooceanicola]MBT9384833.1 EAL domain-containing protein [Pseudooceanicola endophyticus]MXN18173.1 EAL domain-containing protein [Pseudooceanicola albus]